jgi:hypothetical protein
LQHPRTTPCPDDRINQDEGNEITIYTCTQAWGSRHTQLVFWGSNSRNRCFAKFFQEGRSSAKCGLARILSAPNLRRRASVFLLRDPVQKNRSARTQHGAKPKYRQLAFNKVEYLPAVGFVPVEKLGDFVGAAKDIVIEIR